MGGSASGGKSKSKSKGGSTFGQDVWKPQGDALNTLYGNMGSLYNQSVNGMQGLMPDAVDYAQGVSSAANPAWQQQLQGGAYAGLDIGNQLMRNLSNQGPSNQSQINAMIMGGSGNNYADAMKQQYMQDASAAHQGMLANTDARAAAAGMSGGSRHGILQAKGQSDILSNLQGNLARTGYETFDKDLNRKLGIAQMADQNTMANNQMMAGMLQNQQNAMTGGLQFGQGMQQLGAGGMNMYSTPWDMATQYANTIGRPTVLGQGASNSSANSKSLQGGGSSGIGGKG